MQVRLIDRMDEFQALESSWRAVHREDQQATVFLHWDWMRAWFDVSPYPWAVLAVSNSGADRSPDQAHRWSGFLPVSPRGYLHNLRIDQVREIHMAGDPAADATGLLCRPEDESHVIDAFAEYLHHDMPWERLKFKDVSDPRIGVLLERLGHDQMSTREEEGACSPWIELPQTWEEYLHMLSPESRKSLKRSMRAIDACCSVRWAGTDDQDAVDQAVRLARLRGLISEDVLSQLQHVLRAAVRAGFGTVALLEHEGHPIAAQALLIEDKGRSMQTYMSGFDPRFKRWSPVKALDGVCIRTAIDRGMHAFDFLRGDEPYKFRFGAQPRFLRNFTCERTSLGALARRSVSSLRSSLGL